MVLLRALGRPLPDPFRAPHPSERSLCVCSSRQRVPTRAWSLLSPPAFHPEALHPKYHTRLTAGSSQGDVGDVHRPPPIKCVLRPALAAAPCPRLSKHVTRHRGKARTYLPHEWATEAGNGIRDAAQAPARQRPRDSSAHCPLQSEARRAGRRQADHRGPVPKQEKHKTCLGSDSTSTAHANRNLRFLCKTSTGWAIPRPGTRSKSMSTQVDRFSWKALHHRSMHSRKNRTQFNIQQIA